MSLTINPSTFPLVHRPGRIFETLGIDEHWAQGGFEDGHTVLGNSVDPAFEGPKGAASPKPIASPRSYGSIGAHDAPAESMLVEAAFVLPRLPADEPGKYPILTVARDRPIRPEPDVYFHLAYEPFEQRFIVSANVGTRSAELQSFFLKGAPASQYTQRVLRVLVLINRVGIFPSIEDPFTEQRELFGEFDLANVSQRQPWGRSLEGLLSGEPWRITSGAESEHDDEERSFPAGFGLSDLRVTVFSDSNDNFKTLPYSGELDHLAEAGWNDVNPFGLEDGPEDDWEFGDEESMPEALLGLAGHLFTLAGGVNTWARRAKNLAEDTQQLALRLTEEPEATEAWTDPT